MIKRNSWKKKGQYRYSVVKYDNKTRKGTYIKIKDPTNKQVTFRHKKGFAITAQLLRAEMTHQKTLSGRRFLPSYEKIKKNTSLKDISAAIKQKNLPALAIQTTKRIDKTAIPTPRSQRKKIGQIVKKTKKIIGRSPGAKNLLYSGRNYTILSRNEMENNRMNTMKKIFGKLVKNKDQLENLSMSIMDNEQIRKRIYTTIRVIGTSEETGEKIIIKEIYSHHESPFSAYEKAKRDYPIGEVRGEYGVGIGKGTVTDYEIHAEIKGE